MAQPSIQPGWGGGVCHAHAESHVTNMQPHPHRWHQERGCVHTRSPCVHIHTDTHNLAKQHTHTHTQGGLTGEGVESTGTRPKRPRPKLTSRHRHSEPPPTSPTRPPPNGCTRTHSGPHLGRQSSPSPARARKHTHKQKHRHTDHSLTRYLRNNCKGGQQSTHK